MRWHGGNQDIEIHVILQTTSINSSSKYATILKIGFMKEHMGYHGITNHLSSHGNNNGRSSHLLTPQFDTLKLSKSIPNTIYKSNQNT